MTELKNTSSEVAQGAFRDFRTELMNGTTAWEAFAKAGVNALTRITDKLADKALDGTISKIFGSFGSSFFGGGELPNWGTSSFVGPTFAYGGYTGHGDKFEPAGIVHRGEYVMDAETTRRIGVGNLDRLRGYADGGYVDGPSIARPSTGDATGVAAAPIVMNDNRTISIGSGASQETVAQLKEAMEADRRGRYSDVVQIVRQASKRRDL